MYHASNPHALVGGDIYAVARTAGAVRMLIGDVKGKGIPALDDDVALVTLKRGKERACGEGCSATHA